MRERSQVRLTCSPKEAGPLETEDARSQLVSLPPWHIDERAICSMQQAAGNRSMHCGGQQAAAPERRDTESLCGVLQGLRCRAAHASSHLARCCVLRLAKPATHGLITPSPPGALSRTSKYTCEPHRASLATIMCSAVSTCGVNPLRHDVILEQREGLNLWPRQQRSVGHSAPHPRIQTYSGSMSWNRKRLVDVFTFLIV